jgi:hypothetical protein
MDYRVAFTWNNIALGVEWAPRLPNITDPRKREKFLAAYYSHRDAFLKEVATEVGLPKKRAKPKRPTLATTPSRRRRGITILS